MILQADHDLNNLIAQYYQPRLIAEDGEPGLGKGMDGHAGKDLVVKVPCGTLVWRIAARRPAGGNKRGRGRGRGRKADVRNQRQQTAIDPQCQRRTGAGN